MIKSEMAVLIKNLFRKTQTQVTKESAKMRKANSQSLREMLMTWGIRGDGKPGICGDIDNLWNNMDLDKNGMLDKKECKLFVQQLIA